MAARLARAALLFIVPVVLITIMIASFQARLLFPAHAVPPVAVPVTARELEIVASDGKSKLHGLHFAPSSKNKGSRLILGFGGNGWNAVHTAETLHVLFPDDHVVVYFYRGYAPSEGKASSAALLADAPLVYDAAMRASGVKRVIGAGFSIGSGVAAHLATERTLDGLILVTPFDRLEKVAGDMFPWLPTSMLFAHDIDAEGAMRQVDIPTVIIAAGNDEVIDLRRTQGLRAAVRNVVLDISVREAGHNDLYGMRAFQLGMREGRALIERQIGGN